MSYYHSEHLIRSEADVPRLPAFEDGCSRYLLYLEMMVSSVIISTIVHTFTQVIRGDVIQLYNLVYVFNQRTIKARLWEL